MAGNEKTREELQREVEALRARVAELERADPSAAGQRSYSAAVKPARTDRAKAEEEARETEETTRALLNASTDSAMFISPAIW